MVVASYHPERDARIVLHDDDFVVESKQSDLEWVRDVFAAKYILKVRGILGPDPGDQKSIVIFVRVVEWRKDELWWEADPRHVEKILQVCGLVSGTRRSFQGSNCRRSTEIMRSLLETIWSGTGLLWRLRDSLPKTAST